MPEPPDQDERTAQFLRTILSVKPDSEPLPLLDPSGQQFALGVGWIGHTTPGGRVLWRLHRDPRGVRRIRHPDVRLLEDLINDLDDLNDLEQEWEGWLRQEWGEGQPQEVVKSEPKEAPARAVRCLWWDEIEDTVHHIYYHPSGVRWARQAWALLRQAGLTTYQSELDRSVVFLRALVLRILYIEIDSMLWNKYPPHPADDIDLDYWASHLGLTPFRLGWLAGRDGAGIPEATETSTEFELTCATIRVLVAKMLPSVVKALYGSAGGLESLVRIYLETHGYWDDGTPRRKTENGPVSQQTVEALRVWIADGCPLTL